MPRYRDFLVCGVSTQLKQLVPNFDEVIEPPDADFPTSGLKSASLIRMGFLTVLPRGRIIGSIGLIAPDRHRRLLKMLGDYLVK